MANISSNALLVTAVHLNMKLVSQGLLKSFEHFDVISMVDKSTDHGKMLSICFLQSHRQFCCPFRLKFLRESLARERRTNLQYHPFPRAVL